MNAPTTTSDALLAESAWLHRLARAMLRDPERAHDVAQATLVAALERAPAHRVGELRAWLQAVARRLAGRAAREERRRVARERAVARPDGDDGGAGTAARLELHRALCDAVLALPEPYRTAVSLRFFDDLPPRTIAARVGATAAVVRQRVHRGLALLRERFDAADAADARSPCWRRAFAATGLGAGAPSTSLLVGTVVMQKLWLAAAVLVASVVWLVAPWRGPAPAVAGAPLATGAPAPVAGAAKQPASQTPAAVEMERAAVEATFVVRVVDAATERPLAGVTVHRWCAAVDLDVVSGTTAADGSVAFAARVGAGGVLVRGGGLMPLVQPVAELRGETTVRCASGRRVAGRVLVDGAPAPAGLALTLASRATEPGADAQLVVPAAVRDLLNRYAGQAETTTDAQGNFVFLGLAIDWAGELVVPRTHWLLPQAGQLVEDDRLLLTAPVEGLRVETTQLPAVRGRVEWADGDDPVANAVVILQEITFADGTPMSIRMALADDRGRFVLPLTPDATNQRARWLVPQLRGEPVRARLTAQYGTTARQTLEQGGRPLDLRAEVVMRLERPVVRRFRAVDEAGQPLAGVRALEQHGLGEPTGADGIGTSTNPFVLAVGAPGRQFALQLLLGSGDRDPERHDDLRRAVVGTQDHAPIELVLPPGNALHIRVRTADGAEAPAHAVALQNVSRGVPAIDFNADGLRRRFGGPANSAVSNGYLLDRGAATLCSLRPGVECRVVVRDAVGGELATHDIVTPPLGEERTVDVTIATPPRTLRGRVVDGSGAPVALARVALRRPGLPLGNDLGVDLRTGVGGRFTHGPFLVAGDVVVTAHRTGFGAATRTLTRADLAADVQLVLPVARRATVRIVDEHGAPMPDLLLVVETGTPRRVDQQQTAPGEFVCSDLPDRDVTVATSFAGQWFRAPLTVAAERVDLRVPRPARVHIEPPAAWPRDPDWQLVARATPCNGATGGQAEPVWLEIEGGSRPPFVANQLLLPGRYRLELVAQRWNGKTTERRPEGPSAEVELRAGDDIRVVLR